MLRQLGALGSCVLVHSQPKVKRFDNLGNVNERRHCGFAPYFLWGIYSRAMYNYKIVRIRSLAATRFQLGILVLCARHTVWTQTRWDPFSCMKITLLLTHSMTFEIWNTDFHPTLKKQFNSVLCNFDHPDAHIVVQAQILQFVC